MELIPEENWMKKSWQLLILTLFSVGVASASMIPCTITGTGAGGALTAATVVTCNTLTFDQFGVPNFTGSALGTIYILASSSNYDTVTNSVDLAFNPALTANGDEEFIFRVSGGISQIDLTVAGTGGSITERACANPIATTGSHSFVCTDSTGTVVVAPLAQLTVGSNSSAVSAIFNATSPVYIFKDIQTVGANSQLTEFTQSFEIPEPLTMALLGSGLLCLGLLSRRSRKN